MIHIPGDDHATCPSLIIPCCTHVWKHCILSHRYTSANKKEKKEQGALAMQPWLLFSLFPPQTCGTDSCWPLSPEARCLWQHWDRRSVLHTKPGVTAAPLCMNSGASRPCGLSVIPCHLRVIDHWKEENTEKPGQNRSSTSWLQRENNKINWVT